MRLAKKKEPKLARIVTGKGSAENNMARLFAVPNL